MKKIIERINIYIIIISIAVLPIFIFIAYINSKEREICIPLLILLLINGISLFFLEDK